ncbi:carboxymuconolactone decarboxylase family protein [Microbulbifer hainanensis]|uniref:hypothetical protein n=1 Tax=Microbulbifer hainanensis TaxID=2735675 RepID=UPI001866F87A|nr:hypothetical protein [Microbulbifer hainanensis]
MDIEEHRQGLQDLAERYRYDVSYLLEFLEGSPSGFAKFADFRPLSYHREFLSLESYWVSKLAAMQVADCGACLQLSVRMALEAGVDRALVEACIQGGSRLPEDLKDIFDFATAVSGYRNLDPQLEARIAAQLDKRQRIELGVCVATASVYPTIKRSLGHTQTCSLVEIEFAA